MFEEYVHVRKENTLSCMLVKAEIYIEESRDHPACFSNMRKLMMKKQIINLVNLSDKKSS